MRPRAVLEISAVVSVVLLIWGFSSNILDILTNIQAVTVFNNTDLSKLTEKAQEPKCSLPKACPPDHFALHIRSGAADVVGPRICFEGRIIMSYVLNNVVHGLNIVVLNGQNGVVEEVSALNMRGGDSKAILAFLNTIKPGMIVLAASFGDVSPKMTNQIREAFVRMGSTKIKSVKQKDSWVFAGGLGTKNQVYEEHAANDDKTNIYEGWPNAVEVGGCFQRNLTEKL
ncbi:uncharacterized protein V6R79_012649 [Siganus canaliculatus]